MAEVTEAAIAAAVDSEVVADSAVVDAADANPTWRVRCDF